MYYDRVPPFQSWFVIRVSGEWTLTFDSNEDKDPRHRKFIVTSDVLDLVFSRRDGKSTDVS